MLSGVGIPETNRAAQTCREQFFVRRKGECGDAFAAFVIYFELVLGNDFY
jgi:hypothetical protein